MTAPQDERRLPPNGRKPVRVLARATWRGAPRLPTGIAFVVICIVGMVALPYWSSGKSAELRRRVVETVTPLRLTLESVHLQALSLANDLRGFLLTGDRSFLANAGTKQRRVGEGLERAADLAARVDPALARDVETLDALYRDWAAHTDVATATQPGTVDGRQLQELSAANHRRLTRFTTAIDRLEERVRGRETALAARITEFGRTERSLVLVLGSLAAVVVTYLGWLALALLRAQRGALEERDQLEAVLSSVDTGILLVDRESRVIVANKKAHDLLGLAAAELFGVDLATFARQRIAPRVSQPEVFERRLAHLLDAPEVVAEDLIELVRPEPRTLCRFSAPARDETGAVFGRIEVYRDVTETLRRQRELADANERKDRFVATLSHELRTPLTPILGWIELLGRQTDPATLARGLAAIRRNVKLEAQLVEDLLDLSRVVNQKLELNLKAIDVATAVSAAVETVGHLAERKGVRLEVRLPETAITLLADETRFIQVVWNLLSNAIKFTAPGGRVTLSARAIGQRLEVAVEDDGEGIPAEFIEHIFKPFEQAPGATRRVGLGVGLALARSLVELHGGRIGVESEGPGRGSRFTFWMPIGTAVPATSVPAAAAPGAAPAIAGALGSFGDGGRWDASTNGADHLEDHEASGGGDREGLTAQRPRVLVVEDNRDTLEAMRVLLTSWGYDVHGCSDVASAFAALRDEPADVVVSDIAMPGTDGLVFARQLRSRAVTGPDRRPLLLVALSGFASQEDRRQAIEAGFDAYFSKPIDFESLRSLLEQIATRATQPVGA